MSNFLSDHLIHRDNDFIIIQKPAGILTVPGKGDALFDSVLTRLVDIEPNTLLIHRLDRDTSGLLVFALNKSSQREISKQFQNRETEKVYQAVVAGTLHGKGVIDIPVIYDPAHPPLHIVDASYHKPALTHYRVLENFEIDGQAVSRVELIPITGRSHQLRVHLQHLGHPILGDTLYATPQQQQLSQRLCLHAYQLSFSHPHTGQTLHFESAVPF